MEIRSCGSDRFAITPEGLAVKLEARKVGDLLYFSGEINGRFIMVNNQNQFICYDDNKEPLITTIQAGQISIDQFILVKLPTKCSHPPGRYSMSYMDFAKKDMDKPLSKRFTFDSSTDRPVRKDITSLQQEISTIVRTAAHGTSFTPKDVKDINSAINSLVLPSKYVESTVLTFINNASVISACHNQESSLFCRLLAIKIMSSEMATNNYASLLSLAFSNYSTVDAAKSYVQSQSSKRPEFYIGKLMSMVNRDKSATTFIGQFLTTYMRMAEIYPTTGSNSVISDVDLLGTLVHNGGIEVHKELTMLCPEAKTIDDVIAALSSHNYLYIYLNAVPKLNTGTKIFTRNSTTTTPSKHTHYANLVETDDNSDSDAECNEVCRIHGKIHDDNDCKLQKAIRSRLNLKPTQVIPAKEIEDAKYRFRSKDKNVAQAVSEDEDQEDMQEYNEEQNEVFYVSDDEYTCFNIHTNEPEVSQYNTEVTIETITLKAIADTGANITYLPALFEPLILTDSAPKAISPRLGDGTQSNNCVALNDRLQLTLPNGTTKMIKAAVFTQKYNNTILIGREAMSEHDDSLYTAEEKFRVLCQQLMLNFPGLRRCSSLNTINFIDKEPVSLQVNWKEYAKIKSVFYKPRNLDSQKFLDKWVQDGLEAGFFAKVTDQELSLLPPGISLKSLPLMSIQDKRAVLAGNYLSGCFENIVFKNSCKDFIRSIPATAKYMFVGDVKSFFTTVEVKLPDALIQCFQHYGSLYYQKSLVQGTTNASAIAHAILASILDEVQDTEPHIPDEIKDLYNQALLLTQEEQQTEYKPRPMNQIDDIRCASETMRSHLHTLLSLLSVMTKYRIPLNTFKTIACATKAHTLAWWWIPGTLLPGRCYLKILKSMSTMSDLRTLAQSIAYYEDGVKDLRKYVNAILTMTTNKTNRELKKQPISNQGLAQAQKAIEAIKKSSVTLIPLSATLTMHTDWSLTSIGVTLDYNKRPYIVTSIPMGKIISKQPPAIGELWGAIRALQKLHYYIKSRRLVLVVDANALAKGWTKSLVNGEPTRFMEMLLAEALLNGIDLTTIKHVTTDKNPSDLLSRYICSYKTSEYIHMNVSEISTRHIPLENACFSLQRPSKHVFKTPIDPTHNRWKPIEQFKSKRMYFGIDRILPTIREFKRQRRFNETHVRLCSDLDFPTSEYYILPVNMDDDRQMNLIREVHNNLGHPGFIDTIKACRKKGLLAPIKLTKTVIGTCISCSKVNSHRVTLAHKRSELLKPIPGYTIFSDVTHLTPNICLYVGQCAYSKYLFAMASTTATASTTIKFINHIRCKFPNLSLFFTDAGVEFANVKVSKYCEDNNIEKQYGSQSNSIGQVERANQYIKRKLRSCNFNKEVNIDAISSMVTTITTLYNTLHINATTKKTPITVKEYDPEVIRNITATVPETFSNIEVGQYCWALRKAYEKELSINIFSESNFFYYPVKILNIDHGNAVLINQGGIELYAPSNRLRIPQYPTLFKVKRVSEDFNHEGMSQT